MTLFRPLLAFAILAFITLGSVGLVDGKHGDGPKPRIDILAFATPSDLLREGGRLIDTYALATSLRILQRHEPAITEPYLWNYPPATTALFGYGLWPYSDKASAMLAVNIATLLAALIAYRTGRGLIGPVCADLLLWSTLPMLVFTLMIGQPAVLFALPAATAALWLMNGRARGGMALLALASLKPHVGLGLWIAKARDFLFSSNGRRQALFALSLLLLLHGAGVLVLALQSAVTPLAVLDTYVGSFRAMSEHLDLLRHNLLLTAHGLMVSLEAPRLMALGLQAVGLLLGIVALLRMPPWAKLPMGLLITPLITPYFFYYDLGIIVAAMALIAARLPVTMRLHYCALGGAVVFLCSMFAFLARNYDGLLAGFGVPHLPNLGFVFILALVFVSVHQARHAESSAPLTKL